MVRCGMEVGDRDVHSLFLGSFLLVTLATGPQFPHLYSTSVSGTHRGEKGSDPLELELWMVISHLVGSGN